MSGWAKGDLALCVDDNTTNLVVRNAVYRVRLVKGPFLYLDGVFCGLGQGEDGVISRRFKRIKPDTEGANEDDAAWLKDLLTKKVKA